MLKNFMLQTSTQTFFFTAFLLISLYFLYNVSEVLMPFMVAIFFAYFLNPLVTRLQQRKIPRGVAALIVTILFFSLLALFVVMMLPPIYKQGMVLVTKINSYTHGNAPEIVGKFTVWLSSISPSTIVFVQDAIADFSKQIFALSSTIFSSIFSSSMVAFNIVSMTIITPVVTFYILRDWDALVAHVKEVLPKKHKRDMLQIGNNINITLAGYLRGQTLICGTLAIYYILALTVLKLDYSLVLGAAAGFFTFIPYFGAILGAALCVLMAAIQFSSLKMAGIVLGVFVFGQFIEGNFIAPKILGKNIGLHPVWIMFSLLAAGSLFGFFGILIAVPLTAMIGVVIKFLFEKYKKQNE